MTFRLWQCFPLIVPILPITTSLMPLQFCFHPNSFVFSVFLGRTGYAAMGTYNEAAASTDRRGSGQNKQWRLNVTDVDGRKGKRSKGD